MRRGVSRTRRRTHASARTQVTRGWALGAAGRYHAVAIRAAGATHPHAMREKRRADAPSGRARSRAACGPSRTGETWEGSAEARHRDTPAMQPMHYGRGVSHQPRPWRRVNRQPGFPDTCDRPAERIRRLRSPTLQRAGGRSCETQSTPVSAIAHGSCAAPFPRGSHPFPVARMTGNSGTHNSPNPSALPSSPTRSSRSVLVAPWVSMCSPLVNTTRSPGESRPASTSAAMLPRAAWRGVWPRLS